MQCLQSYNSFDDEVEHQQNSRPHFLLLHEWQMNFTKFTQDLIWRPSFSCPRLSSSACIHPRRGKEKVFWRQVSNVPETCANKQEMFAYVLVCVWHRVCTLARCCIDVCVCMCILGSRQHWLICFSFCSCWMSVETHLLYAVHGPIVAALLVSVLSRGLSKKARGTHGSEQLLIMSVLCSLSAGEPLLLTEYYPSAGDQAEGHTPCRVQHVHEGGESHSHPGAAARNPVCHFPLEAGEPAGWGGLRVHHAHTYALPGRYCAAFVTVSIKAPDGSSLQR